MVFRKTAATYVDSCRATTGVIQMDPRDHIADIFGRMTKFLNDTFKSVIVCAYHIDVVENKI